MGTDRKRICIYCEEEYVVTENTGYDVDRFCSLLCQKVWMEDGE